MKTKANRFNNASQGLSLKRAPRVESVSRFLFSSGQIKHLSGFFVLLAFIIFSAQVQGRCLPSLPLFQPPDFAVGYFEVHNGLNGLPCNNIRCILAVDETILVGTEGGGLMVFGNGSWRSFTPASKPSFPSLTVSCLVKAAEGNSVLAGTPQGIVRITNPAGSPEFIPVPLTGPVSRNVLSLKIQGKTIMVGTDREVGSLQGDTILPFSLQGSENTPGGYSCASFYEEQFWFGASNGAFVTREHVLLPFRSAQTDLGWVRGFEPAGKDLYLASSRGLFQITGENCSQVSSETWFTCLSAAPGTADFFKKTTTPEPELEMGGGPALTGLDPESKKKIEALNQEVKAVNKKIQEWNSKYFMNPYLANDPQRERLMAQRNGVLGKMADLGIDAQIRSPMIKGLWAGTQDKGAILFAVDGKRRELTTENSKLPGNRITAVCSKESGETWIGTFDSGLLRYTRTSVGSLKEPLLVWEGATNLIRVGGENLFVGTKENGLLVFNPKTIEKTAEYSPVSVPGFHRSVTGVGVDQQSRLWVAGDKGLWMMDQKGWHRFSVEAGLPDELISCIEIDHHGKIFAAGGKGREISSLLAVYNGSSFTPFSIRTVKAYLSMNATDSLNGLRGLGLIDTYMGTFDVKKASESLALYDDLIPESEVVSMLGVDEYLLLGTRTGSLFAFYGPMFKRVSNEGTGVLRKIVAMDKKKNGEIVLVSDKKVFLMDGQHFNPISPINAKSVLSFTDLAIDDKNPDLFWVSFISTDGGGLALYEDGNWTVNAQKEGITSFALTDPFLYFATEKGVYQTLGR